MGAVRTVTVWAGAGISKVTGVRLTSLPLAVRAVTTAAKYPVRPRRAARSRRTVTPALALIVVADSVAAFAGRVTPARSCTVTSSRRVPAPDHDSGAVVPVVPSETTG